MKRRFVTSMSKAYFDLVGKRMLDTLDMWPDGEFLVYSEDHLELPDRASLRSLWDIPGCKEMVEHTNTLPIYKGLINGRRDYRHDLNRFCRKAFAQFDAASEWDGLLIWVDADIIAHDHIPAVLIDSMVDDHFIAVMLRKEWHLCSSLVIWDCSHPISHQFWSHYYGMYMSGTVLALPQWDDAYVLETCLPRTEKGEIVHVRDMAMLRTETGPYNVFDALFGPFASHKKGLLKMKEAA